jgi:beta-lactamase regulating signal transducer with metallopeptidase domain
VIGELEPLAHRLLGALVNGAIHGLVLTGFVWLIWKTRPRTNAATRHAVGFATLVAVALLPAGHFLLSPGENVARGEEVRPRKGSGAEESALTRVGVPSTDKGVPESWEAGEWSVPRITRGGGLAVEETGGDIADGTGRADEAAAVNSDAAVDSWHDFNREWERRSSGMDATEASAVAGLVASRAHPVREPSGDFKDAATLQADHAVVPDWRWIWRSELRGEVSLALAGLWLGIAMFRLAGLIRQVGWLLRLKRRAQGVDGSAGELFQALCEEVRPGRRIKLLTSRGTTTPLAAGFLSPAVVLPSPASGLGGSAQVESILRHELAHVRRRDDWTNLIQQGIRAVYFFNPAVWWLSRRLTVDREIACDDHVLAARGTPREYAMFLAEFASRIQGRDWVAAPAAWSNRSQLKERIDMLLDTQRNKSTRLARAGVGTLTAITILIAAAGLHAGPRLTFGPAGETVVTTTETVDVTPVLAMETPVVRPVVTIEMADDSGATRRVTGSAFVHTSEADGSTISFEPAPGGRPVQVTSGTRFKARAGSAAPAQPIVPVAPASTPTAPFVPPAPQPHPDPAPHPAPVPPMAAVGWDHQGHDQESMEQRIERLERLVESLVEQKGEAKVLRKSEMDPLFERRHKELELHIAHPDIDVFQTKRIKIPEVDWELMARQQEETERDVRQLERHSERLARETARKAEAEARALARRHPAGLGQSLAMRQRELEHQRVALETERREMEKQRAALDAQLQRIENQLNQLDEQRDKFEPEVEVEVDLDELTLPGVDGGGSSPEGGTKGSDNPLRRR